MTFLKPSNAIALAVFPSLVALACHFIFGHAAESLLLPKLKAQCPQISLGEETPYRLPYTGAQSIDEALCGIVAFFHASFGPQVAPFLTYFLLSCAPILAHVYFESYRPNRPFTLAFPLVFALAMQLLSFGATFSVYWLVFVVSGAAQSPSLGRQTMVTKAHAQSTLFGIFIGMIILTGCMMVLQDPYITAIWQAFPVAVSVASFFHLLVRPASQHPDSGFEIIRGFYLASFIIISSLHLSFITSKSMDELKALLSISFKWDAVFGLLASLLGTVWFGRNLKQILGLLAWNLLATPLVGPGAAFAGAVLWRESRLHEDIKSVKTE
ncbi:hypothetical protein BT96DRAFT_914971 [Gymnopus androsaceus JB14]|uniref:Uncharacterized protein n=1 Tax=Gymnopus androsaceus JB14 TaxID=1447944 RepID=A0A6A4IE79_9AGAR|nr:hypothetical protein BT96DRAFT_914971 [Gymnopus androsaceus JB14]